MRPTTSASAIDSMFCAGSSREPDLLQEIEAGNANYPPADLRGVVAVTCSHAHRVDDGEFGLSQSCGFLCYGVLGLFPTCVSSFASSLALGTKFPTSRTHSVLSHLSDKHRDCSSTVRGSQLPVWRLGFSQSCCFCGMAHWAGFRSTRPSQALQR